MNINPIGVYANAQAIVEPVRDPSNGRIVGHERVPCPSLPFTAYDEHGRTERVTEDEAKAIEAKREGAAK